MTKYEKIAKFRTKYTRSEFEDMFPASSPERKLWKTINALMFKINKQNQDVDNELNIVMEAIDKIESNIASSKKEKLINIMRGDLSDEEFLAMYGSYFCFDYDKMADELAEMINNMEGEELDALYEKYAS